MPHTPQFGTPQPYGASQPYGYQLYSSPGFQTGTIGANLFYLPHPTSQGRPAPYATGILQPHTPDASQRQAASKTKAPPRNSRGTASKTGKKTGQGSKSGALNRREGGGSDDEISQLTPTQVEDASLRLDEAKPNARGLSDEDKDAVVSYITQPEIYKEHRLKMSTITIHVSGFILGHICKIAYNVVIDREYRFEGPRDC